MKKLALLSILSLTLITSCKEDKKQTESVTPEKETTILEKVAMAHGYENWKDLVLQMKRAGEPLVLIHPEKDDVVVLQSMNSGSVMVALDTTDGFADYTGVLDWEEYGYDELTHQYYSSSVT